MHPLSLDKITVGELTPLEMVDLAAELGIEAIGLWAFSTNPRSPVMPPLDDQQAKRALARRLADTGVKIECMECVILQADTEMSSCEPALAYAADLGARHVTTCIFDTDPLRHLENFAQLAEMAGKCGLNVNIEFLPFSPVNSLAAARRLVEGTGRANVGILVDILHLTRTGGSIADLHSLPEGLVRYAQVCDGAASVAPEDIFHEAVYQRKLPGKGVFTLREFMAALPDDIYVGIEVPLKDLRDRGVSARDRARLVRDALRTVLGDG